MGLVPALQIDGRGLVALSSGGGTGPSPNTSDEALSIAWEEAPLFGSLCVLQTGLPWRGPCC
eukprot:11032739-Alexandrium_andersonii.AAC.1